MRSTSLAPPPVDISTESHRAFPAIPIRPIQHNGWVYAPQPLEGPYGAIDDYCRAIARPSVEGDASDQCGFPDGVPTEGPVELTTATIPYAGAKVVFTRRPDDPGPMVYCSVAIHTTGGWYVSGPGSIFCGGPLGSGVSSSVSKKRVTVEDFVMGGSSELVFRYARRTVIHSIDQTPTGGRSFGTFSRDEEDVVVCGLGPSGWPSCTPPFPVVCANIDGSAPVAIRWSSTEPGVLTGTDDCGREAGSLLGSHAVVFP